MIQVWDSCSGILITRIISYSRETGAEASHIKYRCVLDAAPCRCNCCHEFDLLQTMKAASKTTRNREIWLLSYIRCCANCCFATFRRDSGSVISKAFTIDSLACRTLRSVSHRKHEINQTMNFADLAAAGKEMSSCVFCNCLTHEHNMPRSSSGTFTHQTSKIVCQILDNPPKKTKRSS